MNQLGTSGPNRRKKCRPRVGIFIWKISPAKTSASKKQPHGTETKNLAFFEKGACINELLQI